MTERYLGEILWEDIPALIEKADKQGSQIVIYAADHDPNKEGTSINAYAIDRMTCIDGEWVERIKEVPTTKDPIGSDRRWQPKVNRFFSNYWFAYAYVLKHTAKEKVP